MPSRLYTRYIKEIVPALKTELALKNVMQVPNVRKIVLNVGFGRHAKEEKYVESVEKMLATITGQKPARRAAKKSISNFKTRQGMIIGASVTLRGQRMYEFLDRLLTLTLPRVRDFRGLNPKSFDGHGSYTFGFKEHLAFPEITGVEVGDFIHSLEITVVTTAKTDVSAHALLKHLGFPFHKK